jgi:hypothetical protein
MVQVLTMPRAEDPNTFGLLGAMPKEYVKYDLVEEKNKIVMEELPTIRLRNLCDVLCGGDAKHLKAIDLKAIESEREDGTTRVDKHAKLLEFFVSSAPSSREGKALWEEPMYEGYSDDNRATDNAWIESKVYHLHLQEPHEGAATGSHQPCGKLLAELKQLGLAYSAEDSEERSAWWRVLNEEPQGPFGDTFGMCQTSKWKGLPQWVTVDSNDPSFTQHMCAARSQHGSPAPCELLINVAFAPLVHRFANHREFALKAMNKLMPELEIKVDQSGSNAYMG